MKRKGSMFGVVSGKCEQFTQATDSYGRDTFPGDLVPCEATAYRKTMLIDRAIWLCKDCERKWRRGSNE